MGKVVSLFRRLFNNALFRITLSCLILFFVFRSTNVPSILEKVSQLSFVSFILYLIIFFAVTLILSIRWNLLTTDLSKSSVIDFFAASMMGLFFNVFLPSQNGGDLIKWTLVSSHNISKKQLIFSVIFDRIVGLCGLTLLGGLCFLYSIIVLHNSYQTLHTFIIMGLFCASVAFILLTFFSNSLTFFIQRNMFKKLHPVFLRYISQKKKTLLSILLTIPAQLLFFFANWLLLREIGIAISIPQFIVYGSIVSIFISLPLSFSGFGTTELAYLFFFIPFGIQQEQILVFTTTLMALRFVIACIGWIVGTIYQAQQKKNAVYLTEKKQEKHEKNNT